MLGPIANINARLIIKTPQIVTAYFANGFFLIASSLITSVNSSPDNTL